MYQWTEPYEDTHLQERIEQAIQVQHQLAARGQMLVTTYEQLWLPSLNNLPDVSYAGQERYRSPYGTFSPLPRQPFHGALAFIPYPGVELPPALQPAREWQPAEAVLDQHNRSLRIEVEATQTELTFTTVNINQSAHELLREVNRELVRARAGVYLWKITPQEGTPSSARHLYPDGYIPVLSNAHTRADVTGYALLEDLPYQHTLIYVGLAAHKTSVESLWASLIRGRGSCSLRGTAAIPDGEVRMCSQPLPDFGVIHAGIICRKALPGQWEAQDETAYALVFEAGQELEVALSRLALKRLQEALPFPILDEWSTVLWEHGLEAGYIQRLVCAGDCRGGARIDLARPWQELVQNLLEQEVVRV